MQELEKCRKILSLLSENMAIWGKHIDELVDCLSCLNRSEFDALREGTDVRLKFNLARQLLEHLKRTFPNSDEETRRKHLNQMFIVMLFENCEYDYRESILLAESVRGVIGDDAKLAKEQWATVEYLEAEAFSKYVGRLC